MRYLVAALAAAFALAAIPAAAATFLVEGPPAADGSISWVFGNNGGIPAGPFDDLFDIVIPTGGTSDGTVTATFTSDTTDLVFTAVTFAFHGFTLFDPVPGVHDGDLAPFAITGGHHTLEVEGVSPGLAGDYSGTLSFSPAAVPEPASWALMIGGLGLAGATLRARRRLTAI